MNSPFNTTPSQQADFDLEFQEATTEPVKVATEEELPEKYKGKSLSDVVEMHMNAEKRTSQLGNELGQLRKLADQLLELKKDNVKERTVVEPPKPVTVDEIFSDPDNAIKKTVESSGVAKKADEAYSRVENIERQIALQAFERTYPEYKKDLNDPAFQEWVAGNSARAELFRRADQYDVASADALWQMWGEFKELKSLTEQRAAAKEKRQQAISAAKTVQDSPLNTDSKAPVYSRAKLMELQTQAHGGNLAARSKWNDPAFQQELLRAYTEGRVR